MTTHSLDLHDMIRADVARYTAEWPDTTWHAARHLTPERVWEWLGDHGCFIGPQDGDFKGEDPIGRNLMTDPKFTPFERLYFHPPTPSDPHAFLAVRPLPYKLFNQRAYTTVTCIGDIRANLRDKKNGLDILSLSPFLACRPATDSEEEQRDWPPEPCFEVNEAALLATYPGEALVKWV